MAGNNIRISTDQVEQIASNLESLNQQLSALLKGSQQTVDNLKNVYQGEASDATISVFDGFAAQYFQVYEDVINNYVKFLRQNVAAGYFETETANVALAESFK